MSGDLSRLHRFVADHYDLEELRALCLALSVDYDSLRGEGKDAKARELVLYLGRERRLEELLTALHRDRPRPFVEANIGGDIEVLYNALPTFEARLVVEREHEAGCLGMPTQQFSRK